MSYQVLASTLRWAKRVEMVAEVRRIGESIRADYRGDRLTNRGGKERDVETR